MKIFLTMLLTLILLNFLSNSSNKEEFIELRREYTFAACFVSALLFLIYKL